MADTSRRKITDGKGRCHLTRAPDERPSRREMAREKERVLTRLAVCLVKFSFLLPRGGPPKAEQLGRQCVHHFRVVISHDRTNSRGWIEMSDTLLPCTRQCRVAHRSRTWNGVRLGDTPIGGNQILQFPKNEKGDFVFLELGDFRDDQIFYFPVKMASSMFLWWPRRLRRPKTVTLQVYRNQK